MNCPRSPVGQGRAGRALHTSVFSRTPSAGLGACLQATPHPQGSLAASGHPGVRSEAWTQGEGGDKCRWGCSPHEGMGTWPSCLGGTCDTHCCSWCRCGEDTSQPTGTHSGTGDRQEHVCAGTPGPRSAHRCLLLPSEPELRHSWAKALSHKEPTSRGKATQNHDGMTYTMSLAHLVIPEHQKAPLETPQPT